MTAFIWFIVILFALAAVLLMFSMCKVAGEADRQSEETYAEITGQFQALDDVGAEPQAPAPTPAPRRQGLRITTN